MPTIPNIFTTYLVQTLTISPVNDFGSLQIRLFAHLPPVPLAAILHTAAITIVLNCESGPCLKSLRGSLLAFKKKPKLLCMALNPSHQNHL